MDKEKGIMNLWTYQCSAFILQVEQKTRWYGLSETPHVWHTVFCISNEKEEERNGVRRVWIIWEMIWY